MKLYIPTCSLNLNNIMSSDSISPAGLYQHRKYGNKRYFPVEACPNDDAVFLYTKIPVYKVNGRDMENYRVVIEIDSMGIENQLQKIDSFHGVDVYVSESTIYFDPVHTVIMYEGKDAYEASRLQADQSLENKSFAFYQPRAIDRDMEFRWSNSYCKKYRPSHFVHCLDEDYRLDRIKGAIVCYYAGLRQVKSPELATLRKDARKIKNIFSAIANSSNRGLSPEQEKSLEPVIQEFADVFTYVDPVSRHNRDAIDMHFSRSKTMMENAELISKEVLLKIIEELGLTRYLMQLLKLNEPYNVYSLYDILGSKNISELLPVKFAELDRALSGVESSLSRVNVNHICLSEIFHVADSRELRITDKGPSLEFYNQFINALIDGRHLDNKDMKPSLAIAVLGGQTLKTLMGEEKWNSSATRDYINDLLNNIQNGTHFDLLSDGHEILQALAAFSLKGGEIDKLSDFLAQNGVSEYRYAWGMYGAAYGYSGLPKTFTKGVLSEQVFTEINSIVWGTPSDVPNDNRHELVQKSDLIQDSESAHGKNSEVRSIINQKEEPAEDKFVETPAKPVAASSPTEVFMSQLRGVAIGKKGKRLSDETIDKITTIYFENGARLDESFITGISKIQGIGKETINAIRDYFSIKQQKTVVLSMFSDSNDESTSSFKELLFVTDDGLASVVKELRIGDPDVEKTILEGIKHVQNKHMADKPANNEECIKHLNNLLKSDGWGSLKKTRNNMQLIEFLIDTLKQRYR